MLSRQQRRPSRLFASTAACGPYVHDLKELLEVLEQNGVKIPRYLWKAEDLSPFAVETRYPGLLGPVTKRQYRRTVRVAEAVLRWAERQIGKP